MDQVKNCFRIPGRTLRIYFQPCCERFRFRDSYGIDHAGCCSAGQSFFWAALTAYTRVYLGVHFISDIVPGAISGVFFGYLVYRLYSFSRSKLLPVQVNNGEPLYSKKRIRLIVYAIYVTILIIIVFNVPLAACLQK